ncbi:MAG: ATP-binding cassette domain-containing protein [Deltaproteobacteria bacterium]|nr:ATP-binding cassette domain-containing protein [Deltaproteobacteria bacterium]MBW2535905.1 ATP-binding cassette domain-containing protein [Deltaproteobacteria bacterium]
MTSTGYPSPADRERDWPEGYPAIRVRHLWHRFGPREVLRDVTFDVARGEIFGFIGPNGAGKTTTIRIMSTLLEPMAGRVEIEGIDVTMEPEQVRRLIGYMPDHAGVYERITVREFLEFFADAYRIPSLGVVDAVLELTDIQRLQDQLVATLSKGQKQRLQLARILLHDPQVLVLDEPASDLDPRARIEIRDLLLDLQSLGKTIFLSSHILSELSDVCSSVGIIEQGRIVVAGPIDEIAERLAEQQAAEAHGQPAPATPGVVPWQTPPGQGPAERPSQAGAPSPGPTVEVPPAALAPVGQAAQPPPAAAPALPYTPRRGVKLRVLGDLGAAAYSLQGGPGIVDVQIVGPAVQVGYVGGDEKVAEIVAHLVHRNFGVISVEQERNELERIFLEATRHSQEQG